MGGASRKGIRHICGEFPIDMSDQDLKSFNELQRFLVQELMPKLFCIMTFYYFYQLISLPSTRSVNKQWLLLSLQGDCLPFHHTPSRKELLYVRNHCRVQWHFYTLILAASYMIAGHRSSRQAIDKGEEQPWIE